VVRFICASYHIDGLRMQKKGADYFWDWTTYYISIEISTGKDCEVYGLGSGQRTVSSDSLGSRRPEIKMFEGDLVHFSSLLEPK